tara:strand:- start:2029 stop:2244 length:216 start_codon:yes stop_codon:yes gene_type:complete
MKETFTRQLIEEIFDDEYDVVEILQSHNETEPRKVFQEAINEILRLREELKIAIFEANLERLKNDPRPPRN